MGRSDSGRHLIWTVEHEDVGALEFGQLGLRPERRELLTLIGDPGALLAAPHSRPEFAHHDPDRDGG